MRTYHAGLDKLLIALQGWLRCNREIVDRDSLVYGLARLSSRSSTLVNPCQRTTLCQRTSISHRGRCAHPAAEGRTTDAACCRSLAGRGREGSRMRGADFSRYAGYFCGREARTGQAARTANGEG